MSFSQELPTTPCDSLHTLTDFAVVIINNTFTMFILMDNTTTNKNMTTVIITSNYKKEITTIQTFNLCRLQLRPY